MAIIKPFKGVRATRDKVALVSCKSLEIYTDEKLKAKLDFNPYTFLQVVHAVYKYADKDSISQEQRFQLVKNRYLEFKENSILKKDEEAAIYIYKKIKIKEYATTYIAGSRRTGQESKFTQVLF